MKIKILRFLVFLCLITTILLFQVSREAKAQAGSAYDLIAAVNALRSAQGLTPLQVDPILMAVAQGHSDYQASLGYWTHEGPGGTRPKDRAMAAGFGGGATIYVSENVAVMNTSASFETLIYSIWSDALHWNTMTNPSYTHAGAGVTVSGSEVYYTLDVAYIAGSPGGYVPGPTYTPGGVLPQPTAPTANFISPVITSTPQPDGSIIHTVESGQALWSIAIAYGTTILEILNLNHLDSNNPAIWPGTDLLIRPSQQATISPTPSITVPLPTRTPHPTKTLRPTLATRTATLAPTPTPEPSFSFDWLHSLNRRSVAIIIIVVCSLGMLTVFLTGFRPKK